LGTLINVPNINITYLSVAYSSPDTFEDVKLFIKENNNTILGTLPLTFTGDGNITSIASNTMNITTTADRALKLVLDGSLSVTEYVNIRTILVGFF
jgi:ABC-type uncharacterized transport system YnjBCD substrate-binding protein